MFIVARFKLTSVLQLLLLFVCGEYELGFDWMGTGRERRVEEGQVCLLWQQLSSVDIKHLFRIYFATRCINIQLVMPKPSVRA